MKEYSSKYVGEAFDKIKLLANKISIREGLPNYVIIENGIILPRKVNFIHTNKNMPYQGLGGVITNNGTFVKESYIYDLISKPNQNHIIAFGGGYEVKEVSNSNKTVIYMGLAHQHWGHFLIDIVQRTWYLLYNDILENKSMTDDNNLFYAFSGFGNYSTEFKNNFKEFFRLLGIDTNKILFVNKPTQFKKVIVPDVAVHPGEYIYPVFKEIFNKVSENAIFEEKNREKINKIYFSRTHLKDSKEMGEKHIEVLMKRAGFTILYPEELSLTQQIFYWQTADEIACINGTIPHNCVFAHKNLKLFIFNKMQKMVGYQFTMDAVWGSTPIYVKSYKEPFSRYPIDVSRGPFWISITKQLQQFAKLELGVTVEEKSKIKDWINYIMICILAEGKYRLRGSKAKAKIFINKLKK